MKEPGPIIVTQLFPEVLDELIALLSYLSEEEWQRPTACPNWSVKDIALHLLGGDIGILSRRRDGFSHGGPIGSWEELVALVNGLNDTWVKAARRLSPRLLCDLLMFTGTQVCAYFETLNPFATAGPVEWAGDKPAAVWLDLAREYTERWHHQQQIRDAVGKPGLKEPRYFAPVLDAFVRALPRTYRDVDANEGTLVALTISGESGGRWLVLREPGGWKLYLDIAQEPAAEVVMDEDLAWRLFTKGVTRDEARKRAQIIGDAPLAAKALDTISVIA
ncbi:MAG TPA: maleylpyruvate isomerase family mycothiol-dependent enzyme [Blastocatellia bacterium]|jgi:uncharacterized protein (TIGR03083 family)|nr:maleylpyruvate isomerase family mycothiol-dependent enzyme [Blastocatellia bacterium]